MNTAMLIILTLTLAATQFAVYSELKQIHDRLSSIDQNSTSALNYTKETAEAVSAAKHETKVLLSHIRNNGKALLDLFAKLASKTKENGKAKKED